MILVVGLGNPGEKYKNTRHNVGYVVLDKLQSEISNESSNFNFQNKFNAEVYIYSSPTTHNSQLILAKPQTFMNDSGVAVKSLADFYKISTSDILVVHDDLDVKLGEYKIQEGVGPKLHYGISSIEGELKTKDFWRVRVGIENRLMANGLQTTEKIPGEEYVLQNFTNEEVGILEQVIAKIVYELKDKIIQTQP